MEKKEYKSYPNPIVWNANARVMNFTNESGKRVPNSGIFKAGMFFGITDEEFYKSGKTYEASSSTTPKLLKEHSFAVGDTLKSQTITAIDTSNEDYDIITVDASITVTGGEIVHSNDIDPDGLVTVLETKFVDKNTNTYSLTVTDRAIYEPDKMPNYSTKKVGNVYLSPVSTI